MIFPGHPFNRHFLSLLLVILLFLFTTLFSQTHFTLPKNVWRFSVDRLSSKSKWIGREGEEGFPDEYFTLNEYFFGADSVTIEGLIANPKRRRTEKVTSFRIEYGLSDRFTFNLKVPYFSSLSEEANWEWISSSDTTLYNEDTVVVAIVDSLMEYYHPDRLTSGLGDIRWGFNFLILGSPAWEGESLMSLYGGIGMKLPTARIIEVFNESDLDSAGRPNQFNQFPLGDGVTQWRFSLFGEFYREILERLIRINWRVHYWFNVEGKFWTRVTPRGQFTLDHDRILQELGKVYRLKLGDVFVAEIDGFLELIPDRLSLDIGQSWLFKQRDRYYSGNEKWDEWMAGGTDYHEDYDTRVFQVVQSISVLLHNIHPLKKFGPVPFELITRMDFPFLTRYNWSRVALSFSISMYFQLW